MQIICSLYVCVCSCSWNVGYFKLILILIFFLVRSFIRSFCVLFWNLFLTVYVNLFFFHVVSILYIFLGFYADQEARCQVFRVCTNTDLSGRGSMILLFIHVFFSNRFFYSLLLMLLLQRNSMPKRLADNMRLRERYNEGAFKSRWWWWSYWWY